MVKEKLYRLNGFELLVTFEDKLIRIKPPITLQTYLSNNINIRSLLLVNYIKEDYYTYFGKELKITNDSIMVEIWGHLFASYCARGIKKLLNTKLTAKVTQLVIERSDIIDCGERGIDSNRVLWDVLSKFKVIIIKFIPRKIKEG